MKKLKFFFEKSLLTIVLLLVLGSNTYAGLIIEHNIKTRNSEQPLITIFLRAPAEAEDLSKVSGILAYCTWESDPDKIRENFNMVDDDITKLFYFADQNNLAVLSWTTQTLWRTDKGFDELSREEKNKIDQGFDIVAKAWDKGIEELVKKYKLPEKDYLLYGISRGAQWAHRLVLRKPERFLAVHIHINSTYDQPTVIGNRCLWLVTTGEMEHGYSAAKRFYLACKKLHYPIIFKAAPNLGHSSNSEIEELRTEFFRYALEMRKVKDTEKATSLIQNPMSWIKDFENPPYFGDLVNQEVYSSENVEEIPLDQRVQIPNAEIAKKWGDIVK